MFTDMIVQTGMHTEATVIQAEAEKEPKLKQSHFSLSDRHRHREN